MVSREISSCLRSLALPGTDGEVDLAKTGLTPKANTFSQAVRAADGAEHGTHDLNSRAALFEG